MKALIEKLEQSDFEKTDDGYRISLSKVYYYGWKNIYLTLTQVDYDTFKVYFSSNKVVSCLGVIKHTEELEMLLELFKKLLQNETEFNKPLEQENLTVVI